MTTPALTKRWASFFDFLDATVGKGQYTVFLSADHGAAHVAGFAKEMGLPGGTFDDGGIVKQMNAVLKDKYGKDRIIRGIYNYQVVLNNELFDSTEFFK